MTNYVLHFSQQRIQTIRISNVNEQKMKILLHFLENLSSNSTFRAFVEKKRACFRIPNKTFSSKKYLTLQGNTFVETS